MTHGTGYTMETAPQKKSIRAIYIAALVAAVVLVVLPPFIRWASSGLRSDDPMKRMVAILTLNDQEDLRDLVINDPHGTVRLFAIERLSDQKELMEVIRSGEQEPRLNVRLKAALKLNDPVLLTQSSGDPGKMETHKVRAL